LTPKVKRDEIRENRIMMEVVVDVYGAEEIPAVVVVKRDALKILSFTSGRISFHGIFY